MDRLEKISFTLQTRWRITKNNVVNRSDVLIVLGSRLDIRQTGSQTAAFKGDNNIS